MIEITIKYKSWFPSLLIFIYIITSLEKVVLLEERDI
jgi:hypothetical protein